MHPSSHSFSAVSALDLQSLNLPLPSEPWKNLQEIRKVSGAALVGEVSSKAFQQADNQGGRSTCSQVHDGVAGFGHPRDRENLG